MRIPSFSFIVDACSELHRLQDCNLVIDAQNFFYDLYEKSSLPLQYGAECDKYAAYVKKYLVKHFTKYNIKCFFIFKGGAKNLEKKISDHREYGQTEYKFHPVFANDIHLQVLDEIKMKYIFTEYEAKADCIALAKEMSCPVLSYDAEFAFAGVQYIPHPTLKYGPNGLNCKIFLLENFFKYFSLNERIKLLFFIMLTDIKVFPENTFKNLYETFNIPEAPPKLKLERLLNWLSKTDSSTIRSNIINHAKDSNVSQEEIHVALNNIAETIEPKLTDLRTIDYFTDRTADATAESWFKKGVALNFIAKQYIDMYRSNKLLMYSAAPENVQTSLKIIKYAYDLLTNFRYDELKVLLNHMHPCNQVVLVKGSVEKPVYEANECVFENGWNNIVSLRLFQHFMITDNNFDFDKLEKIPSDARLLFITLVYLHRKQPVDAVLSQSIILSYVMLGVVKVGIWRRNRDAACDQDEPTISDCKSSEFVMRKYTSSTVEINDGIRCSLIEFQHCLQQFNYLNRLCGSPFEPTVYSKTFNATFVSSICRKREDETNFFNTLLGQTPSVLNIFNRLIGLYKELL